MRLFISVITLFLFSVNAIAQTTLSTTSTIKKVTVFRNKAQIESDAQVQLGKGKTVITVQDIAGTTDVNSLQINGVGNFTILGVKYQTSSSNKGQSSYADSLKSVVQQIDFVKMQLEVAAKEVTMISQNASNIKSTTDGLFVKDFNEMIEFTRKKLTETGERSLKLQEKLVELEKSKQRISSEYNNSGGSQQLGEILITVSASNPTKASLNLTYIANSCGWNPAYDIRSTGTAQPIKLNYQANVYQRTGIDWKDVKISLSTTNPLINNTKPELYPVYLSVYEPQPVMMRNMKVANAEMSMDAAPAPQVGYGSAERLDVNVSESTLAVSFDIAVPYSIPSTGNPETIDIQSFDLPAAYTYVAVPKFNKYAFLVAKISDWEKLNLLPGEANIYFEGTYIGKTYINGSDTKDELTVSLGAATKIIVERKSLEEFKSRRFIGGNVREKFVYETTIRNTKNESVNVTVEEQIPVSQDSRIEISYDTPSGFSYDVTTGKVTYVLTLAPNQTATKRIEYEVKYPKDLTITNL